MTENVHLFSGDRATFICPKCSWSKTVSVAEYLRLDKEIKLKIHCKCGHTYIVKVDRRKLFRKPTDLYGTYIKTALSGSYVQEKTGVYGEVTVTNLSCEGIGIRISEKQNLKINDQVSVEFHLDDGNHSRIQKKAIVNTTVPTLFEQFQLLIS